MELLWSALYRLYLLYTFRLIALTRPFDLRLILTFLSPSAV
jgi:hypothetical protein